MIETTITVRIAEYSDFNYICDIYEAVLSDPEMCRFTNWAKGVYPTPEFALKAIEAREMYVALLDKIPVASMLLNSKQLPEYELIPWKYVFSADEVLVIHTLCVHPEHNNKGLARRMIDFAEDFARENSMKAIRLDTYEGNLPALTLYQRNGYEYAGKAFFNFMDCIPENLICLEKLL